MKRALLIGLISVLVAFDSSTRTMVSKPSPYRVKTIVLDAGHGGHDPGCLGASTKEKHIALAIVLKLGKLINEKMPDVKVIYTRDKDVFVELHERAAIANRNNADLFISVHCNAAAAAAHGTETWVMGEHKNDQNLDIAKRENSVITLEDDYESKYEYNPNSPVAHIIFSLYQNAYLIQSLNLAHKIEDEFKNTNKLKSRGVKQAGFVVLYRTAMPSVLIESGFLTNRTDERYLMSSTGQQKMAQAIFNALQRYRKEMEGDEPVQPAPGTVEPIDTVAVAVIPTLASEDPVFFKVQFAASPTALDTTRLPYNQLSHFTTEPYGDLTRYYTGYHTSAESAKSAMRLVRSKGFSDAFVVAWVDGKRMSLNQALAVTTKP